MKSLLTVFLLSSILYIFAFGVMSMNMDMNGSMSSCPFMGHDMVLCPMGLFEHISLVQAIFNIVPSNLALIISIFLLLALSIFAVRKIDIPINKQKLYRPSPRNNPSPLSQFLSALSDGIIQPKLYA